MSLPLHRLPRDVMEAAAHAPAPLALVGGAVRDLLLPGDTPLRDLDFLVLQGRAEPVARWFADHLPGAFVPLSPEHDEYRVVTRDGLQVDLAGLRGPTLQDDLKRRDFTWNAMAWDLSRRKQIDPWGGQKDLARRRLRTLRRANFRDDPLRILRGFRLMARLGGWLDPLTLRWMIQERTGLLHVAGERIHEELMLLTAGPHADRALYELAQTGILFLLFPELEALPTIPEVDVLDHTLDAIRFLVDDLNHPHRSPLATWWDPWFSTCTAFPFRSLLILGLLLHDVAKPLTYRKDHRGIHFYEHEKRGAEITEQRLAHLRFSRQEIQTVVRLVRLHMYPHLLAHSTDRTPRAVARYLRKTDTLAFPLLLMAVEDAKASPHVNGGIGNHLTLLQELIQLREREASTPRRILTGNDLIAMGYTPGPLFRTILEEVAARHLAGELRTPEEARAWVRKQYPRTAP
ncbi:MAG: HD domain-containing protein [Candidatus Hydrothermae bacterium]|nr:HD domain-containing protein [Candidatus Hydrothermae bacterium]